MCTSSMINTLWLPCWGWYLTCSISVRMCSTLLLEAASSSKMLKEAFSLNDLQEEHSLQGSTLLTGFSQLITLARILAQVVLPTPRGPQNKKACANWSVWIAFCRVLAIWFCPITSSKRTGLYLRAETTNLLKSILWFEAQR